MKTCSLCILFLFVLVSNAHYIKKLGPKVATINELEPKFKAMSDEELREQKRGNA